MKILIIDDSEIIYNRLNKFISRNIDNPRDSVEAISQLENLLIDIHQKAPDILIINTYSLRGILVETIRAVKTILPQTYIICLTEFYENSFEKILRNAGADHFLDIANGIEQFQDIFTNVKENFL